MNYTIANLENRYNVELDELGVRIKELGVRRVLLQLPDGLKPWAACIADYLSEKCDVEIRIWLGSCFGACDLPASSVQLGVGSWELGDVLVVQFGHAAW